jgi:hypothetical protein
VEAPRKEGPHVCEKNLGKKKKIYIALRGLTFFSEGPITQPQRLRWPPHNKQETKDYLIFHGK